MFLLSGVFAVTPLGGIAPKRIGYPNATGFKNSLAYLVKLD